MARKGCHILFKSGKIRLTITTKFLLEIVWDFFFGSFKTRIQRVVFLTPLKSLGRNLGAIKIFSIYSSPEYVWYSYENNPIRSHLPIMKTLPPLSLPV